MEWSRFDWLLDAALQEDAVREDVTSRAVVPEGTEAAGEVLAGEVGVVCGLPPAGRLARRFDERLIFEQLLEDGGAVSGGAVVARLSGPARAVLAVERPMLNFLQHLSGVATLTARFVEKVEHTDARIYDTRKTTPGWRDLEKYAVRCGGGCNHRPDLAGAVLIKDNHLALAGGAAVGEAVRKAREACPDLTVEVEVDDLGQFEEALAAGPDIILLDNMTPEQVREAAEMADAHEAERRLLLEASGGIILGNAALYAEAGADRISVGALTHSAPALDLSLRLKSSEF